ncbi:MAG: phasin family protein [Minwuia sp.]|uniref:phasin family protein n=1 Tax=Minwuia sp. TaxID=2493630 RepID=UPI003A89C23D
MPTPANPFADFSNALKDMKLPAFDMDAFVQMQKKNVEAMTAANQIALDGMRALFERQVQIAQNSVEEAQAAIRVAAESKGQVDVQSQIEAARAAMEKAQLNIRELSEMATKSQTEIMDILQKRMMESVDEMKNQFGKS